MPRLVEEAVHVDDLAKVVVNEQHQCDRDEGGGNKNDDGDNSTAQTENASTER